MYFSLDAENRPTVWICVCVYAQEVGACAFVCVGIVAFAHLYAHRGYNLGDKVLFERLDSFNTHLPRTHALLDKGYKIRVGFDFSSYSLDFIFTDFLFARTRPSPSSRN